MKIFIDAGHNYGGDDGAYSKFNGITYSERDINMQISSKLKRNLEARGFEVKMTREASDKEYSSVSDSLKKRVNIANMLNGDFFISIHQNAASVSNAYGVEAYYSTSTPICGSMNSNKIEKSKSMAVQLTNSISSSLNRYNRGAKNGNLYVTKNTRMPSLLLECGFITNYDEVLKLTDEDFQFRIAEVIGQVIDDNF